MNQIPSVPMINPYMVQQPITSMPVPQQPNYNAVKIDIHNPQVGTAGVGAPCAQPAMPYYSYPQAPIYNYPQAPVQQPVYYPPVTQQYPPLPQAPQVTQAPTVCPPCPVCEAPAVQPAPAQQPTVIVEPPAAQAPAQTTVQQQNINVPVQAPVETTKTETPSVPEPVVSTPEAPKAQEKPEIVPSETVAPQVDINQFIAKLANPDFEVQASAMEEIANMIKQSPEKATELVDTKIFDALTGIINNDTSALEGPTQEQISAREKLITGKEVTDAEKELANKITPKELAERNKSYALFTSAMMQKLYGDEVAKLSNQTVPLTELPGVITVVDNLKDNPNPMVRASAIEALSYIQNPAYKKDLNTVFTIAQNDSDPGVAETAKVALEKLNQI
ncbi:hypothetical protein IJ541_03130 [bacterium]|nr:hypothetical protein [bacterium]